MPLPFEQIERERRTAIYIRISTAQQQTDRQRVELLECAQNMGITIRDEDIYEDIISGFKEGEVRTMYSKLLEKVEDGTIKQILISEFSRLDRKPSNLFKSIEYFSKKDVHVYFKKQKIWVRGDSDIGTQIMISVLGVMSQYEIELFAARGLDGKITAIKRRGIHQGGATAYGYKIGEGKKLEICEEEAEVVRRIFQYYLNGKSSLQIAEILNSENIEAPYKKRIEETDEKRKQKGLPEKERRFEKNDLKWRPSSLNRLIKNKLYIGKRSFTFYEPDPSNAKPIHQRTDRKEKEHFECESLELQIIDEDTFNRVNALIEEKRYNKNLGLRHENLLKELLRCGDCGSRYSVGGGKDNRKYKCYGTINRIDKKRTCDVGTEVQMTRLDGLVVQLCMRKFTDYNIEERVGRKISEIDEEISTLKRINENCNNILEEKQKEYSEFLRRTLKMKNVSEDIIQSLVAEENEKYEKIKKENTEKRNDNLREISKLLNKKQGIKKIENIGNVREREHEIRQNKTLLNDYIHQFISTIELFRMNKLWSLVVVHFFDGSEYWGSVKNARYKNEEMFYDEMFTPIPEYKSWFLNNEEHCFRYDKKYKLITYNGKSEIYTIDYGNGILQEGTYTMEDFQKELERTAWIGSFPAYKYEED